jgi:hypothetical protein
MMRVCLSLLGLDERITKKVIDLIMEAGNEFSCLACPSRVRARISRVHKMI